MGNAGNSFDGYQSMEPHSDISSLDDNGNFWLPSLNSPYKEGDDIKNFNNMDISLTPIKPKYLTCYRNPSARNMGKHYSIHITTDT